MNEPGHRASQGLTVIAEMAYEQKSEKLLHSPPFAARDAPRPFANFCPTSGKANHEFAATNMWGAGSRYAGIAPGLLSKGSFAPADHLCRGGGLAPALQLVTVAGDFSGWVGVGRVSCLCDRGSLANALGDVAAHGLSFALYDDLNVERRRGSRTSPEQCFVAALFPPSHFEHFVAECVFQPIVDGISG